VGELIRQQGATGAGNAEVADATLIRAEILSKLNQPVDAAKAYLDFVDNFRSHPDAAYGLESAMVLLQPLVEKRDENPGVADAYRRTLKLAVDAPFNRIEYAYALGRELQQAGTYKEAAEAYAKV